MLNQKSGARTVDVVGHHIDKYWQLKNKLHVFIDSGILQIRNIAFPSYKTKQMWDQFALLDVHPEKDQQSQWPHNELSIIINKISACFSLSFL